MENTYIVWIHRQGNNWVFDDRGKGIKNEAFVMGSSEIIEAVKEQLGKEPRTLMFSDVVELEHKIELQEACGDQWSLYHSEETGREGWLCPVLYQYFEQPPETIYFSLE